MSSVSIAVLGAGPAGLGLAWRLALRGFHVTLIEAAPQTGGNSGSFEIDGQIVDFGSHRLHPSCPPAILADIRAMLGSELLDRPRHGRIHLLGSWLHFPLKPLDIAFNAPPRFAAGVIRDSVARKRGAPPEETFASVLENGLGTTIAREFYFPYARKIWGLSPPELDAEQARRRVSAGTLSKLVGKILGQAGKKRFFYPRRGFGSVGGAYAVAAEQAGVRILTSSPVAAIERTSDGMVVKVDAGDGEAAVPAALVLSTIPLPLSIALLRPSAPAHVLASARSLRYRAMILVYLVLPTPVFTEYDAHYFPSPDIVMTRLSEPKNYSLNGPAGSTVLCAEIPCDPGDSLWDCSDGVIAQRVIDSMRLAGIPWQGAILRVVVKRLRQAYPVYVRGYGQSLSSAASWVDGLDRFVTLGRQGLFVHDNTHHTLAMAYAAAECVQPGGKFDHAAWRIRKKEFEGFTVED